MKIYRLGKSRRNAASQYFGSFEKLKAEIKDLMKVEGGAEAGYKLTPLFAKGGSRLKISTKSAILGCCLVLPIWGHLPRLIGGSGEVIKATVRGMSEHRRGSYRQRVTQVMEK